MRRDALAAGALACALATPAGADEEASNRAYVAASQYGDCYARAVPTQTYGTTGRTTVFVVQHNGDRQVENYDWFAPRMRLECNVSAGDGPVGLSVVALGPWARGRLADNETLAIAFYRDGALLRRYSTLDIAGRPDNVRASISHYEVIEEVIGYRWRDSNRYDFVVRTIDGRIITFDAGTGAIIETQRAHPGD